jgi:PAS domain S-box-containing protein
MQADCSEALPQAYLPEWTATTLAEVSMALSELQSELRGVSDHWQLATSTLNSTQCLTEQKLAETAQVVRLIPEGRDITEIKLAEAALRESEARLQAILAHSPVSIYLKDLQGQYLLINPEAEKLSGFSQEQLIGKTDYEILPLVVAEELRANDQKVLDTLTPLVREEVVPWKHGLSTYISVKFPLFDAKGIPNAICGISTDITERKRAEEQIRFQARLLDVVEQAIITTDLNGSITYWNRFAETLYGWQSAEVIGRNILEVTPGEVSKSLAAEILSCLQRGESWSGEFLAQRRDGTTFPAMVSDAPIFDHDGVLIGIVGVTSDITQLKLAEAALRQANQELELRVQERTAALSQTNRLLEAEITERKLAEEELQRSEERFRRALVHAPFPIMIHAEDGEVIQINQAWTEETGYIHSDIPTTADWIARGYEERRELVKAGIDRLYDLDTRVWEGEFTIKTRYGETKIWDFSSAPLGKLGNGKRLVISMAKDVTDRKQAEEAQRQSEARFRAAIEGSLDAFFIFQSVRDEGGQIVDFAFVELNSNAEKMISRRKEEVIGKRLCELLPINRAEGFFEKYVHVVETQEVLEEEFPFSSPEITASWLHHQVVPLADGIAITSKDITRRKMAEEALRESEERFRQLVETTSDWIWQVDENAVYTYVSPQVRDILGYEIEAVLGKTPFDFMPPEEAQRVANIYSHLIASRQPFTDLENTNIHKDLRLVVLETSGVPVFDKAGNFRGYRGIDRDITQRQMAQEVLRTSEERFRSLSACSPVGIFETDLAGRCLYTNPRYQEICSCTLEETLGEGWLQCLHPEERARVFAEWSLYARDGREYSKEFRIQTQEGIVRWIHVRSSPMFSAQGELIGHVGTVEDITSRRQAEADILAALHRERELSELRNSFLSLVSHEFRTPLTTIRSSTELLERYNNKLSDEKKQTHYRRIESAVDRMTHLLDEVLLIGQAEAGKLKFEPQPMDLVPWCRDLVEAMQAVYNNQQQSTTEQYALTFTSSGECTDAQIDEKLLAHILTNLLSNAIKYSLEGGTVQFDLVCTAREAIFCITDSGIGIPAEYLPQLFESFQRASNVGTIQGTGLGLAIVKKAVDLHRGTIAVESEVGVGTTFTVRLPLKSSPLVSN